MTKGVVNQITLYECSGCQETYETREDAMECYFNDDCAGAEDPDEVDSETSGDKEDEVDDAEIEEDETSEN